MIFSLAMFLAVAVVAQPPKLPFAEFASWAVITVNAIPPSGKAYEVSSVGMHVEVSERTVCRFGILDLYPNTYPYSGVRVANYSAKVATSRLENNNGTTTNCTSTPLAGPMPYGGADDLTPRADIFAKMVLRNYAPCNGYNCSVWFWQGVNPDGPGTLLMQWFLSPDNVPQVLLNQTFVKDPASGNLTSIIRTTAYDGYHEYKGWNEACTKPNVCGSDFCIANPSASIDDMKQGLAWVCGGIIDCSNITEGGAQYLPDTTLAHATWAFNAYYQQYISQGPGACNFNGAAELVVCDNACTVCNASATASPAKLMNALTWVCGPQGIQDCSAIQPGGEHFYPNTTLAHATWAFNTYYQAYKCIPEYRACDFNGTASIVPCP